MYLFTLFIGIIIYKDFHVQTRASPVKSWFSFMELIYLYARLCMYAMQPIFSQAICTHKIVFFKQGNLLQKCSFLTCNYMYLYMLTVYARLCMYSMQPIFLQAICTHKSFIFKQGDLLQNCGFLTCNYNHVPIGYRLPVYAQLHLSIFAMQPIFIQAIYILI